MDLINTKIEEYFNIDFSDDEIYGEMWNELNGYFCLKYFPDVINYIDDEWEQEKFNNILRIKEYRRLE